MKSFMDKGDLVPDEIVSKLVFSELAKKSETSWLLDGEVYEMSFHDSVFLLILQNYDLVTNMFLSL